MITTIGNIEILIDHEGNVVARGGTRAGYTGNTEQRLSFNALLNGAGKELEYQIKKNAEDLGVSASVHRLADSRDNTLKQEDETGD